MHKIIYIYIYNNCISKPSEGFLKIIKFPSLFSVSDINYSLSIDRSYGVMQSGTNQTFLSLQQTQESPGTPSPLYPLTWQPAEESGSKRGRKEIKRAGCKWNSEIEITAKKLPKVLFRFLSRPVRLRPPHGSLINRNDHLCLPTKSYPPKKIFFFL